MSTDTTGYGPAMASKAAFDGKVVILTGGASGIGRAMGTELQRRGAIVTLADVNGPGVEETASHIGATAARVDVRDPAAVQALVDRVADEHGRIDFLFNNAGVVLGGETHAVGADHWRHVIDINLLGVVHGVAAAYPRMVAQGFGHIINTASTAGLAPAVFVPAYTASKHGVVGLSAALRPEAAARGVRVSVLCPGAIDTPILDASTPAELDHGGAALSGREYMSTMGLKLLSPERFAPRALDAVAKNRAIVVVPGSARALWWLNRTSPWLVDRIGDVMTRRVQRAMDRAATSAAP